MTKLVRFYLDSVDTKNICLAGGVFANVKVNQLIREMAGVDNIFLSNRKWVMVVYALDLQQSIGSRRLVLKSQCETCIWARVIRVAKLVIF